MITHRVFGVMDQGSNTHIGTGNPALALEVRKLGLSCKTCFLCPMSYGFGQPLISMQKVVVSHLQQAPKSRG